MKHLQDKRAIAKIIAETFEENGAVMRDDGGVLFALFLDDDPCAPMPVAKINLDRLAADIERALS